MITQDTIKTMLETIFPNITVVPKQGNWFNPQDKNKVNTWVAFIIRNAHPVARPSWQTGDLNTTPILTAYMIGELELQIVGERAEQLVQSISLWISRSDINDLFDQNQAQIMYDGIGNYEVSNFIQDGLNSVLAYNLKIPIQWANMIQFNQTVMSTTTITGDLTIGA